MGNTPDLWSAVWELHCLSCSRCSAVIFLGNRADFFPLPAARCVKYAGCGTRRGGVVVVSHGSDSPVTVYESYDSTFITTTVFDPFSKALSAAGLQASVLNCHALLNKSLQLTSGCEWTEVRLNYFAQWLGCVFGLCFLANHNIPHTLNPNASALQIHIISRSVLCPLFALILCPDGLEAARSLVLLTLGFPPLMES
ncbi:unnamed protein product [Leuciscus chuanchicus]